MINFNENTRMEEDTAEGFFQFAKTLPLHISTINNGLEFVNHNERPHWEKEILERLYCLSISEYWQIWGKPIPPVVGFVAQRRHWCMPTPKLVRVIKSFTDSVIDLGAGSGFFARILEESGIKVRPLEYAPTYLVNGQIPYCRKPFHSGIVVMQTIEELCNDIAIHALSHSLLISWANKSDSDSEIAVEIRTYREHGGKLLIIAGSSSMTGSPPLWSEIKKNWRRLNVVNGDLAYRVGMHKSKVRFYTHEDDAFVPPNPLDRIPKAHHMDENKDDEGDLEVLPAVENKSFENLQKHLEGLNEKLFFDCLALLPESDECAEKMYKIKNIYAQFVQSLNDLKKAPRKEAAEEMALFNKMEKQRSKWAHRLQKLYKKTHSFKQPQFIASALTHDFGSLSHLADRPKRRRRRAAELALRETQLELEKIEPAIHPQEKNEMS